MQLFDVIVYLLFSLFMVLGQFLYVFVILVYLCRSLDECLVKANTEIMSQLTVILGIEMMEACGLLLRHTGYVIR